MPQTDAANLGREGEQAPKPNTIQSRTFSRIEIGPPPSPPDDGCLYISEDGITLGVDTIVSF